MEWKCGVSMRKQVKLQVKTQQVASIGPAWGQRMFGTSRGKEGSGRLIQSSEPRGAFLCLLHVEESQSGRIKKKKKKRKKKEKKKSLL